MNDEDLLIWGFGLIGAALALGILEFFIPSAGIIAITATIVALGGVVAFWSVSWVWGVTALLGTTIAAVAMVQFALKIMPYTPMGRGLILRNEDEGEMAHRLEAEAVRRETERALLGAEGVALTALRPVGSARIAGSRYEVLAQGGSIEQGARLRVTDVEGNQIKVRAVE